MNENTRIVRVSHNGKILKDVINNTETIEPELKEQLEKEMIEYLGSPEISLDKSKGM